jgi:hypothetical protein
MNAGKKRAGRFNLERKRKKKEKKTGNWKIKNKKKKKEEITRTLPVYCTCLLHRSLLYRITHSFLSLGWSLLDQIRELYTTEWPHTSVDSHGGTDTRRRRTTLKRPTKELRRSRR